MKTKDLIALLNRAAAAINDPMSLTVQELAELGEDLEVAADQTSLGATAAGDECPLCNSGTVEHREGEVRCKGECGSTAQMAHLVGGVVALVGNLSDGFHAVGPFTDMDYAAYRMSGEECWLMTLNSNPDYLER